MVGHVATVVRVGRHAVPAERAGRRAVAMRDRGAAAAVRTVRPVPATHLVLGAAANRVVSVQHAVPEQRVVPADRVVRATLVTLAGVAVIRAVGPIVAMSHAARGVAVAAINTVGPALSRAVRPTVALRAAPVDTINRPRAFKVNPSAYRKCWLVSVWRLVARRRTGFAPRASRLTARLPH